MSDTYCQYILHYYFENNSAREWSVAELSDKKEVHGTAEQATW